MLMMWVMVCPYMSNLICHMHVSVATLLKSSHSPHHGTCLQIMSQRVRFDGSSDDLADILKPFVTKPNWLKYGERTKAPLEVPTLIAHKGLIQALTSSCHNLAFKKEIVMGAFSNIAAEKQFPVLSTGDLVTEWCEVMTDMLRTVCRHVSHARVQKRPPRWLVHLGDAAGHDDAEATLADTLSPVAMDTPEAPPASESQEPHAASSSLLDDGQGMQVLNGSSDPTSKHDNLTGVAFCVHTQHSWPST